MAKITKPEHGESIVPTNVDDPTVKLPTADELVPNPEKPNPDERTSEPTVKVEPPVVQPAVKPIEPSNQAPVGFYDITVTKESRFNPVRSAGNLFTRETATRVPASDPNLAEYLGNELLTCVPVQEEAKTEA